MSGPRRRVRPRLAAGSGAGILGNPRVPQGDRRQSVRRTRTVRTRPRSCRSPSRSLSSCCRRWRCATCGVLRGRDGRACEVSAPAADSAPQRRRRFAGARASRRATTGVVEPYQVRRSDGPEVTCCRPIQSRPRQVDQGRGEVAQDAVGVVVGDVPARRARRTCPCRVGRSWRRWPGLTGTGWNAG
jgi:hypothetical protein